MDHDHRIVTGIMEDRVDLYNHDCYQQTVEYLRDTCHQLDLPNVSLSTEVSYCLSFKRLVLFSLSVYETNINPKSIFMNHKLFHQQVCQLICILIRIFFSQKFRKLNYCCLNKCFFHYFCLFLLKMYAYMSIVEDFMLLTFKKVKVNF